MITKAKELYARHERWVPIVFFVLGFLFDAAVLHRIDEPMVLVQQAAYLLVSAALIGVELIETTREVHPPGWLAKPWKYREALLHFLLGTLLNSYTIFYFKSSSALTSFVFIALLVGLLMVNEFKRFGKSQTPVHVAFWSLCLISYLIALVPILLGFIGAIPFLVALAGACAVFAVYYRLMSPKLVDRDPRLVGTHLLLPFASIQTVFALLYFGGLIPPVPLSVSYLGIFHEVRKDAGEYELLSSRPWWKFWQHGDQTFLARPGDTIHCFVRVFSPSRFKERLQVRWSYYDERGGWQSADAIPLPVTGGREEGYRATTKKANYQPGDWRVQIETADGRELGRIGFVVERDDSTEPREMRVERQ